MSPQVCIYGRSERSISADELQRIAVDGLVEQTTEDDLDRITIVWDDEELQLITLPPSITSVHISQLRDYIADLSREEPNWLLSAIDQFKLVQAVQYRSTDGLNDSTQPKDVCKGMDLIRRIVRHYQGALFVGDSLYRESGELIVGPPNVSTRLLWDRLLDASSERTRTELEEARWQRTKAHLTRRRVPLPAEPLFGFGDEKTVRLRDSESIAQRLLVVAAIARSTTNPKGEKRWLQDHCLQVLPAERRFFKTQRKTEDRREAYWYVESVWTLLWSLGYVKNFNWPGLPSEEEFIQPWLERLKNRT